MDAIGEPQKQQHRVTTETATATATATTDSNSSPEFEFWMLRNPSFPQPNLLSADELFVDGVLRPLHLLPSSNKPDPMEPQSGPSITESAPSTSSASKRWKDIFKKKTENNNNDKDKEKGKKKKERKGGSSAGSAELNINIWPFSRSRSAGNAATRPRLFPGAPANRKVNSAPCSRSNSAGESKSRKWPSSPGRPGLHVGRSSPVWQFRRAKTSEPPPQAAPSAEKVRKNKDAAAASQRSQAGSGGGGKAKVLNLNVPMCIGYRPQLSCRSDENGAIGGGSSVRGSGNNINTGGGDGDDGGSGSNIFNLRHLFTKKSVVTSH